MGRKRKAAQVVWLTRSVVVGSAASPDPCHQWSQRWMWWLGWVFFLFFNNNFMACVRWLVVRNRQERREVFSSINHVVA